MTLNTTLFHPESTYLFHPDSNEQTKQLLKRLVPLGVKPNLNGHDAEEYIGQCFTNGFIVHASPDGFITSYGPSTEHRRECIPVDINTFISLHTDTGDIEEPEPEEPAMTEPTAESVSLVSVMFILRHDGSGFDVERESGFGFPYESLISLKERLDKKQIEWQEWLTYRDEKADEVEGDAG